jgi:kynureninase
MKLTEIETLDANDSLATKRDEFDLKKGLIYLDGNSLGALPKSVKARINQVVEHEWGQDLIKSWNQHEWIDLPQHVGEKIAKLIGAAPGQVICCDSISVNLFKVLCSAMQLNPERSVVLSTTDNFPTDLYMAQGLSNLVSSQHCQLKTVSEENLEVSLNESIAVLMLTQVNFRTGALLDIQHFTKLAHSKGIVVIWDLAHSAGALPIHLDECHVDFAVGCGYKYLNGGPGSPAFLYVAKRHQQNCKQPLSGWMGHKHPFSFNPEYQAAENINQYLCGTPSILAMSALDAALDVWHDVDIHQVRRKSIDLAEAFITLVEQEASLNSLTLSSSGAKECRGSQLAYEHDYAYAICQALMAKGVIADFRAPNILRFGFTPLYTSYKDIWHAVQRLKHVVENEAFLAPEFNQKAKVT